MIARRSLFSMGAGAALTKAAGDASVRPARPGYLPGEKTWLFFDLWKFDGCTGVNLRQGQPVYQPQATYEDPLMASFSTWPLVYRDGGQWRMLYTAKWQPYTLLTAVSPDGKHWKPDSRPEVQPPGVPKLAPHHLFTLPSGSGGVPYLDPQATDGNRFRIFAIQHGEQAMARAARNPRSAFHKLALSGAQPRRYFVDHLTLVSRDGLAWKADYNAEWSQPGWYPEPPVAAFFNRKLGLHTMVSRTGHGERRLTIQDSADARSWSGPELLLQPDSLDEPLVQFYGMPVVPYEGHFIGLLWHFHNGDSTRLANFNHNVGPLQCFLAYSYDGIRFSRGLRTPFIPLNPPGEPGCGVIQTSCLVEADDELRIYSSACRRLHGMSERIAGHIHILLHTLRRDGFMYLEAAGNWGTVLSKPITLFSPKLTVNAAAPQGEVRFQLTTLESKPIPGFTFDDCIPLTERDDLHWEVKWKGAAADILRKPIRLEIQMRHARLYSVRGNMHFIDAQDWHMLTDGHEIDPRWFDI